MTLKPGIRLGPYEVVSQLRFAGRGEIYRGCDHEQGRDVTIRVVRVDGAADSGLLRQLAADVLDTALLSHPSIPKVYRVGTAADTLYVVSESFDGETLRTLLDSGGLSVDAASACIAQVESALAVASEQGVSHGDLRADNVLVTSDGRTVVLGFGFSAAAAAEGDGAPDEAAVDVLRRELLAGPSGTSPRLLVRVPKHVFRRTAPVVGLVVLALGLGAFVTLSIQRARLNVQASRTGPDQALPETSSTAPALARPSVDADLGVTDEAPDVAAESAPLVPFEETTPVPSPVESLAAAQPSAAVVAEPLDVAPNEEERAGSDSQLSVGDAVIPAGDELLAVADTELSNEAVAVEAAVAAPPLPAPSLPEPAADVPSPGPVSNIDSRDTRSLVAEAMVRVAEFDLPGAMGLLSTAAARGDAGSEVGLVYLRGLADAREAFRDGGTAEALAPVHAAIEGLGAISQGRRGSAEIARLVLQAAAAAAQSERDEMRLYLETAIQMEVIQSAAGLPGAPLLGATEIAGDLWLQVDRYEDARRAYADAADRVGPSLRMMVGNARASSRLKDVPAACTSYGGLVETWGARPGLPPEVEEARTYVEDVCGTAGSADEQTPG